MRDPTASRSNETKMSDGGRERTSIGVEVWRSSQEWGAQRSAVRSIASLGLWRFIRNFLLRPNKYRKDGNGSEPAQCGHRDDEERKRRTVAHDLLRNNLAV